MTGKRLAAGTLCSWRRALRRRRQQQQRKSKTTTTRKSEQLFLWLLLGISMAMGWMGRVAEAAFAPGSRAELGGPSSGEGGVYGCVGACGRSLSTDEGVTYCYNPGSAWHSGTGVCVNANTDVPSGQGTGKYGAIGSWDVSAVKSLASGAWGFFRL